LQKKQPNPYVEYVVAQVVSSIAVVEAAFMNVVDEAHREYAGLTLTLSLTPQTVGSISNATQWEVANFMESYPLSLNFPSRAWLHYRITLLSEIHYEGWTVQEADSGAARLSLSFSETACPLFLHRQGLRQ
jgi:hypothetical protein